MNNIKTFAPKSNLVAIVLETLNQSEGGIYIPDTAQKDKPTRAGQVLLKGPEALEVNIGDTVIFPNYIGMDLTVDNQKCVLIYEDDIICIME